MQVKVLYSFNNNPTVFLCRSQGLFPVKTISIPLDPEPMVLGAFDLRACALQVLERLPESFKLHSQDYAVYYKDITEQPHEPFVASGVLSQLARLSLDDQLVPGRVSQNVSASFLFGDKASSSMTLEVRLKFHTIDLNKLSFAEESAEIRASEAASKLDPGSDSASPALPVKHLHYSRSHAAQNSSLHNGVKRDHPTPNSTLAKRPKPVARARSSESLAVKATRTKSLPIFNNISNKMISSIMAHDMNNTVSRYDSKSVQDRFKLALFMQDKIIDKPKRRRRQCDASSSSSSIQAQRAMRTRSMMQVPTISSPIHEESLSDSDDTEYKENAPDNSKSRGQSLQDEDAEDDDEDDEDEAFDEDAQSPYTPQQPPYKEPIVQATRSQSMAAISSTLDSTGFQSLPDLEDLDGKKTHTIHCSKLPHKHGLVCINANCADTVLVNWRYFETEFRTNYLAIHRAKKFEAENYEGMFGPLCNACFLFLRSKGFMRPKSIVKKYLQQKRYKRDQKFREEHMESSPVARHLPNSLDSFQAASGEPLGSSPFGSQASKFVAPTHTPSYINQAILNQQQAYAHGDSVKSTPNYDVNNIMLQINAFGGPLTDIDPVIHEPSGNTPPMMATKSNTRVINLSYNEDNKENCPPPISRHDSVGRDLSMAHNSDISDFENMIRKSFCDSNSPSRQNQWMGHLFADPTPIDEPTPRDGKTPVDQQAHRSKSPSKSELERISPVKAAMVNMPSLPLLSATPTSDSMNAFLRSNGPPTFSEFPSDLNALLSTGQSLFGTPSPQRRQRMSSDTLDSSWVAHRQYSDERGVDESKSSHRSSTPTTDFYSNDGTHSLDKHMQAGFHKAHEAKTAEP